MGRSFYDFYHALDNPAIEKCHRDCKLYDEKGGDGGAGGRGGGDEQRAGGHVIFFM